MLLLAGLFDEEPLEAKQSPRTRFAVLTTAANSMLSAFHSRMPVLLSADEAAAWLAEPDPRLLRAARDDLLVATPVSLRVNSIRHDDPACLRCRAAGARSQRVGTVPRAGIPGDRNSTAHARASTGNSLHSEKAP